MPGRDGTARRSPSGLDDRGIQATGKRAVARMPKRRRVRIAVSVGPTVEEAQALHCNRCDGANLQALVADVVRAAAVPHA
jgi:hypothetical protein